ncbi:hypothetical protein [Roseisalinus antarcticus]|uniref:Chitin-binding type-2 domain-containing protein n=1 Tax=Roseisalinus antarcticus TaxID=254357 RepID=A0A1Y5T6L9_9RHOB|nr:hypothetical protein [Roseisalinus antarcticus]SLN54935.1 hypothetical protein ROA7023_02483 [Roseisalinus antarcticus]
MKTALTVLILTLLPGLAAAQCFGDHSQQAMSCADGMQYDAEAGTCTPIVTG